MGSLTFLAIVGNRMNYEAWLDSFLIRDGEADYRFCDSAGGSNDFLGTLDGSVTLTTEAHT